MNLTAKQREVIERMARGGQCRSSDISGAYCGDRSVRPVTIASLHRLKLIEPISEYTWGTFYGLTELGQAAAKGEV